MTKGRTVDDGSVTLPGTMWHVTVTVNGEPFSATALQAGLATVEFAHPFGLSARYAEDLVELRYWDEGSDCRAVTRAALNLWDEHRRDARLPAWPVVGLEVLDRPTFRRRWPAGSDKAQVLAPGVRPL